MDARTTVHKAPSIHPALAWPHGKSRLTGDKQGCGGRQRERGVGAAAQMRHEEEK